MIREPTELDRAVLQDLADGMTIRQVARARQVSPNTVSMRLMRCRQRLDLPETTTTGLVVLAIRLGWIS